MKIKKLTLLLTFILISACSNFQSNKVETTDNPVESLTDYASSGQREVASLSDRTCNEILLELINSPKKKAKDDFYVKLDQHLSTERKNEVKSILKWSSWISKVPNVEEVRENFDALLFIDYKDTVTSLIQLNRQSLPMNKLKINGLYDGNFKKFDNAYKYLHKERPPFTIDTLKKLHSLMMEGGVDGIPSDAIGRFRFVDVIGNVPESYAISEKEFLEISQNDYLSTKGMQKNAKGRYFGRIGYPTLDNLKPKLQTMLAEKYPELWKDMKRYEVSRVGMNREELTSRMINALTEDLLSWFVKQKDGIGDINTPEKFREFVNAVAVFQKSLISIHPFRDGNGRTVREFAIYYPFMENGFLPPRIIDPNQDIYASTSDWMEILIKGSVNSQKLYESMATRIDIGLPYESTPELFLPYVTDKLKISLKQQKSTKIDAEARDVAVNISEAVEYFMLRLEDKETFKKFQTNTGAVYNEILEDYEKLFLKSTLDYEHEKKGLEHLSLHFADFDFRYTFGKTFSSNPEKWNYKMNRWYSSKEIIWRGLSRRNEVVSQDEIVGMFTKINSQFTSNRLASKIGRSTSQADITAMALEDFNHYNSDLINGGLEKMAKDHSETGPMYGVSYGYSTSKKREVGKAFAMGAMVIAPYGQHMEMQHMLKSRVLVGMRRSDKDVDLTRLKQLRPDFSYKYPRQQEVMGVGAADPDSVAFVQTIDAEGGVIKSYVRNPANPNQVLVFDKEVSNLEEVPSDYIEVINLN